MKGMFAMKQKEIYILHCYIHNYKLSLERELNQMVQNIRYRPFDRVDLLELMLLQEKLQTFNAITRDILYILNLKKYSDDKENTV